MKKTINLIIGILVSAFFVYIVFRKIDFSEVFMHMKNLDIFWILWFVGLFFINNFLRGYRWYLLSVDVNKGFKTVFSFVKIVIIGSMLNNILPLRMGDVIRAYLIGKKHDLRKSYVFGTVIIERIFDVLTLFILLSLFLLFVKQNDIQVPNYLKHLSKFGLLIGVLSFFVLIYFNRYKDKILDKLNKLHDIKLLKKITKFIDSLMDGFAILNKNHHILNVVVFSLLLWFFESIGFFFIGQAFHLDLNIWVYVLVMISVCLSTLIPSGPGYVGVFEGACIASLALFGVEKELALAYAVVLHSLQIITVTVFGVIFSLKEGLSISDLAFVKEDK
jgi:hypothetical protein